MGASILSYKFRVFQLSLLHPGSSRFFISVFIPQHIPCPKISPRAHREATALRPVRGSPTWPKCSDPRPVQNDPHEGCGGMLRAVMSILVLKVKGPGCYISVFSQFNHLCRRYLSGASYHEFVTCQTCHIQWVASLERPKVSLMIYNEVLLVGSPKKEEFRNIERFAKNWWSSPALLIISSCNAQRSSRSHGHVIPAKQLTSNKHR